MDVEQRWNDDRGKQNCSDTTCHNSALSITNPTRTVLEMNLDVLSEKPATNRLRHGSPKCTSSMVQEEEG
jgi:hypothetical protein